MSEPSSETLHASCVAIGGHAVLLSGPSGCGKSDLALRLIDRGARLVSDDYTLLVRNGPRLLARPPETIAGKIEVRGIGLVDMPHESGMPVALLIRLDRTPERLPEPGETERLAGIEVPVIALEALEPSAPIKAELAIRQALAR